MTPSKKMGLKMVWLKQKKVYQNTEFPMFGIRPSGIALNSILVERHKLNLSVCHAEVYLDEDGKKMGFKFISSPTDDSYVVGRDGGGSKKQTKNGFIACGVLVKSSASLKAMMRAGKAKRPAVECKEAGIVYFNMTPAFDNKWADEKASDEKSGVYRYLSEGEVVYIGQGNLVQRISCQERADWVFDDIEYVVIDNESERFQVEADLLDEHLALNGKLPMYNRVRGRRSG